MTNLLNNPSFFNEPQIPVGCLKFKKKLLKSIGIVWDINSTNVR